MSEIGVFADIARSIGLHNGVVGIKFARLDTEGKAGDVLDLILPQYELRNFVEGLRKLVK
jgi:hypothetical protein